MICDLQTGAERELYSQGGLVEEVALSPSGEMDVVGGQVSTVSGSGSVKVVAGDSSTPA